MSSGLPAVRTVVSAKLWRAATSASRSSAWGTTTLSGVRFSGWSRWKAQINTMRSRLPNFPTSVRKMKNRISTSKTRFH